LPFCLVVYGHRSEKDCADIETIHPFAPLDPLAVANLLEQVRPKGKTPIDQALRHALAEIGERPGKHTILLLSDGLETCGGDACALLAGFPGKDRCRLHVVGFDVGKQADLSSLECLAQAGGGRFFSASAPAELAAALTEAVDQPMGAPGGTLSLKAMRNGQLADVLLTVEQAGRLVSQSRTYRHAQTNPRKIPLPPGTYRIRVSSIGLQKPLERLFEDIPIELGVERSLEVEFSSGRLTVRTDNNGQPTDCTVVLLEPGGRRSVASRRTYRRAEGVVLEAAPGSYDLEVVPLQIEGAETVVVTGLQINGEESLDRSFSFASGELWVKTEALGALVDCRVEIVRPGQPGSVAASRSYSSEKSNPVRFVLSPGSYQVNVLPIDGKRLAQQSRKLELLKGERQEIHFELAER
jgi:Ca-activated chloride channel family protein